MPVSTLGLKNRGPGIFCHSKRNLAHRAVTLASVGHFPRLISARTFVGWGARHPLTPSAMNVYITPHLPPIPRQASSVF